MVLYKWTQLNNLIEAERATFAAIFDEKLRPKQGRPLFWAKKYYGFLSIIIRRFTSGLIIDYNVYRNNNIFNMA